MKTLLLSALCAFFMSGAYADNQKQSLADKAKELIKQDRERETKAKEAELKIIKLLSK